MDALMNFGQGIFGGIWPAVWTLLKIVLIVAPLMLAVALCGAREDRWRRRLYALAAIPVALCLFLTFSKGALVIGLPAALRRSRCRNQEGGGDRLLGLAGRKGRIEPDMDADIVLLDAETLRVRATLVMGETVYERKQDNRDRSVDH